MFPLQQYDYSAYGWLWRSDLELNLFQRISPRQGSPDIRVSLRTPGTEPDRVVLSTNQRSSITDDGFRFRDRRVAVTDSIGTSQIMVYPGPDWNGVPASFYGTTTGALMVWRGGIPFHASAVEIDGEALLLCGPAGAGKSTVAAALLTRGAKLVSDDLSVLRPVGNSSPPLIYSGRRCIRLFPQTAVRVRQDLYTESIPTDGPKELLVVERVESDVPIPFGGFIFLGIETTTSIALDQTALLELALFRPGLFSQLRGSILRQMTVRALFDRSPVAFCPALDLSGDFALEQIADQVLASWQKARYPLQ